MARGGADGGRLRVAIVGVGPKGLFALERLLDHARHLGPGARLDVDLFEPHPSPGAGPVYDPAQPDYLRMNFASDRLDMWWPQTGSVPARERLSFVDWRGGGGEAYAPRGLVGRYLADGFERLLRHAPRAAAVTLRPVAVRALDEDGGSWSVRAADGVTRDYDEVLATVGHGTAIDALPTGSSECAGAVFPVDRLLSEKRIAAGAAVAVRGFALTFVDAALALTEGRGGTFGAGEHPFRLRYEPGNAGAGVILPYSRTGRPMLAKPEARLAAGVAALGALAQDGSEEILALRDGFTVKGDLVAILASAAGAALLAANGRARAGEPLRRARVAARSWLAAACEGAPLPCGQTPAEELERSLAVGAGAHPPDLQWALGETWRGVYPALVRRLGADGLGDRQWPAFRRLAGQMERVAFGPPPVNAAKLLALIEAGRVDLGHVAAGRIVRRAAISAPGGAIMSIAGSGGERPVDAVVNAVLAPPGIDGAGASLLGRLLADGHVRVRDGRRGVEVGSCAGAVGCDGAPRAGLSVLGRATEDCVIGNDTLNRALHPHADRWARRVASRAAALAPLVGAPGPGAAP